MEEKQTMSLFARVGLGLMLLFYTSSSWLRQRGLLLPLAFVLLAVLVGLFALAVIRSIQREEKLPLVDWGILLAGLVIFTIHIFGDDLAENGGLVPLILALVVGVFGVLAVHTLRLWLKSDEQVMDFGPQYEKPKTRMDRMQRQRAFATSVALAIFFLIQTKFDTIGVIFCSVALVLMGFPVAADEYQCRRGREGEPLFPNVGFSSTQLVAVVIHLFGVGFMCFWLYLAISHRIWFMTPPGIIFLAFLLRVPVAALRIFLKNR